MSDDYTPREMRLMEERDRALCRAETAEAVRGTGRTVVLAAGVMILGTMLWMLVSLGGRLVDETLRMRLLMEHPPTQHVITERP